MPIFYNQKLITKLSPSTQYKVNAFLKTADLNFSFKSSGRTFKDALTLKFFVPKKIFGLRKIIYASDICMLNNNNACSCMFTECKNAF